MHVTKRRFSFIFSGIFNPTLGLLFSIFLCSLLLRTPLSKSNIKLIDFQSSNFRRVVSFNPNVDLTTQFNFNVKQIFLYARLNYKSGSSEIIWSKIVQREDEKIFDKICKSNYEIRGEIGTEVELELRGNVFPFVGIIRDFSYGSQKCFF